MTDLTPLFLLILFTGVELLKPKVFNVREGEIVVMHCHQEADDTGLIWTIPSGQKMNQTSSASASADQSHMGVLIHGWNLVVLRASLGHQGNYSCSLGNGSSQIWFRLTVCTAQSREYEEWNQYPVTCYTQEPCTLYCPAANVPCANISGISSRGITWNKEGETSHSQSHFSSVQLKDSGMYICTRSYMHKGQIYYKTFAVVLNVQTDEQLGESVIVSPKQNQVFQVDLGEFSAMMVIDCKAVMTSETDEVFWLSGESFVEEDDNLPVFYNYSWVKGAIGMVMTTSLIFKKVSEDDLSRNYTCKLQSDHQLSTFVTIILTPKVSDVSISLIICIVGIIVVVFITTAVAFSKFKVDVVLFLRDALGSLLFVCLDGKKYDACLMFYKSNSDVDLGKADRKWMKRVLEERFGYSLCLLKSVSECIEQSRTLVLFPSSSDSDPGSDLLIKIWAALAEKNTCVILIKPETKRASSTDSASEVLQHLSQAGNCVVWKGRSSMEPKSSFWKLLRFHLSAPQHPPKLLPEESTLVDHCQHV
uniref:Ig-like domain-containing protein n=1 Tax=Oryzias latipes TaxID=8090 RepID=A0A3P9ICY5_ORYLA